MKYKREAQSLPILIMTVLCIQVLTVAVAKGDSFGQFARPSTGAPVESEIDLFIKAFISKRGDSERLSVLATYTQDWQKKGFKIDHRILHAVIIGLDSDQYKSAAIKIIFSRGILSEKICQRFLLKILSCYNDKTEQTLLGAVRIIKDYDGVEAFEVANLLDLLDLFSSDQYKLSVLKIVGVDNGILNLDDQSKLRVLGIFKSNDFIGAALDLL
ncbi:MAG: hypothetical protein JNM39_16620 [Bdellovibrionaceae bacterium]|nr:hypothetical protein [Pseudobdellovibrionaceae bacterium]